MAVFARRTRVRARRRTRRYVEHPGRVQRGKCSHIRVRSRDLVRIAGQLVRRDAARRPMGIRSRHDMGRSRVPVPPVRRSPAVLRLTDSRWCGSSPAASVLVDSRFRGNDDSKVIPAEAGIHTALTEAERVVAGTGGERRRSASFLPHLSIQSRPIQKSPSGVCVSPYWSLARREYPGIEGVPPSNEGKMPSIPALPARSSPPVPTFEEPCIQSNQVVMGTSIPAGIHGPLPTTGFRRFAFGPTVGMTPRIVS